MTTGIYCIENTINGKKYIGKGRNVEKRMADPHAECPYLRNALEKYGSPLFKRYLVETCSSEELTDREKYYIKQWGTKVPNGYNLTDGGEGILGYSHGEETKEKVSIALRGKPKSEEHRKKLSEANKGKPKSEEQKKKQSESTRGRVGKPLSDEAKKKLSVINTGKVYSEESRKKKSESLKKRYAVTPYRRRVKDDSANERQFTPRYMRADCSRTI